MSFKAHMGDSSTQKYIVGLKSVNALEEQLNELERTRPSAVLLEIASAQALRDKMLNEQKKEATIEEMNKHAKHLTDENIKEKKQDVRHVPEVSSGSPEKTNDVYKSVRENAKANDDKAGISDIAPGGSPQEVAPAKRAEITGQYLFEPVTKALSFRLPMNWRIT